MGPGLMKSGESRGGQWRADTPRPCSLPVRTKYCESRFDEWPEGPGGGSGVGQEVQPLIETG